MSMHSFGIALLRHGAAADRARRHRLLHLSVLRLHQRVYLARDARQRSAQHRQRGDILGEMVARGARRQVHRRHVQKLGEAALQGRAAVAQGRKGTRSAAVHGAEGARLELTQALLVAQQLVDPGRHLEAEGDRQGVLAVGPAGHDVVAGGVGVAGEVPQQRRQVALDHAVGAAHQQQVGGLRDVDRGGAPVQVAAGVAFAQLVDLPHQGDQGVSGYLQVRGEGGAVHQVQLRLGGDFGGRRGGDDAELRLRGGQSHFDVEPSLVNRILGKQDGERRCGAHGVILTRPANGGNAAAERPREAQRGREAPLQAALVALLVGPEPLSPCRMPGGPAHGTGALRRPFHRCRTADGGVRHRPGRGTPCVAADPSTVSS